MGYDIKGRRIKMAGLITILEINTHYGTLISLFWRWIQLLGQN